MAAFIEKSCKGAEWRSKAVDSIREQGKAKLHGVEPREMRLGWLSQVFAILCQWRQTVGNLFCILYEYMHMHMFASTRPNCMGKYYNYWYIHT
jgi:hypothetical protein